MCEATFVYSEMIQLSAESKSCDNTDSLYVKCLFDMIV